MQDKRKADKDSVLVVKLIISAIIFFVVACTLFYFEIKPKTAKSNNPGEDGYLKKYFKSNPAEPGNKPKRKYD